jgi:expansin (peptidoglycan-binding protein)
MALRWSLARCSASVLTLGVFTFAAQASTVITTCTAPYGWRYNVSGQGSWTQDGIDGGSFILIRTDAGSYDVITKDRVSTSTFAQEGAKVIGYDVTGAPGTVIVVAVYPGGATETMQFSVDRTGRGSLIWAMLKPGGLAGAAGLLLQAKCER